MEIYPKGVQPNQGKSSRTDSYFRETHKKQRNMNMLESDLNGNGALLSAANSFSRNVNDTELVMTSRIWNMDLRVASSFG